MKISPSELFCFCLKDTMQEREQEREEFQHEIRGMESKVKETERLQTQQNRLEREVRT